MLRPEPPILRAEPTLLLVFLLELTPPNELAERVELELLRIVLLLAELRIVEPNVALRDVLKLLLVCGVAFSEFLTDLLPPPENPDTLPRRLDDTP